MNKKRLFYNPNEEHFIKYRNSDDKCTYPFTPDPLGYCWSFAHHIDKTKGYEDMEKICKNCECWKEKIENELKKKN